MKRTKKNAVASPTKRMYYIASEADLSDIAA